MEENNMMNDFLQQFVKSRSISVSEKNEKCEAVFFQLCFDDHGRAYLNVVGEQGEAIETDYRLYSGETFNVLRSIERIRQGKLMDISWGEEEKRIYLHEYTYLLYELLRCDNLVDGKMQSLRVSDSSMTLQLILNKDAQNEITASFSVVSEEKSSSDFMLLSDTAVLVEQTIYSLKSIGENYESFRHFAISFPEAWLEHYLSVFFSYLESVTLVYEDYLLEYAENPVVAVPTLIFEKVDADMALYLHLTATASGYDSDFIQRFDLVYVASVTMEHKVVLHRITKDSAVLDKNSLHELIGKFAPNKQAEKEIYEKENFFIVPQETAGPFLLGALPSLLRQYRVLGAEQLYAYKVKQVNPKLHLSLKSGIDYLEGSATVQVDGEDFPLRKFLKQYKQQQYIELADGELAIIDSGYVDRIGRVLQEKKGEEDVVNVSIFDLLEVEELMQQKPEGDVFDKYRKIFEGFNQLSSQQMEFKEVNAQLRDYQKEGVKWINYLYENNLGGCLADDMGLGKTLQTITMLSRIYPKTKRPSLLVMPRSLLFNWQDELKKFAPQLSFYIFYGNDRDFSKAMRCHLILTTYALVRNDVEEFGKQGFEYIILDESQNIKNVNSQTTQAITLLHARHKLAISGTPIENNLTELYSLFRFLNPTMFGSLDEFNRQYTYPIQRDNNKDVMTALRRKIFPFMLRRLKKDVLKELPDRIQQTLYVEMSNEQRDFYEQRRRYYYDEIHSSIKMNGIEKTQFVMFQALNELRRIASVPESLMDGEMASPKVDMLIETLMEAVGNGHKVVVFFNFIAGIELVGSKLDEFGVDFTTMTGSTHDRRSVVERFQNDPSCKVLLMTLKTGGVGLNLTVADTVFIFEPWWNKAAEEQAINRLHRMGQKAKVMSYSLVTQNTIEEKICLLQQKKAQLFDGLIGADSSTAKRLSEDDIEFILGKNS